MREEVQPYTRRGPLNYGNTNRLLKNANWDIELSKTGYINEAGRCLVMHGQYRGRGSLHRAAQLLRQADALWRLQPPAQWMLASS